MNTPVAAPTPLDQQLIATFGYTSRRALADLECLTRQELQTVVLRQEGYSYTKIAGIVGAGLTTRAAEKQGERGMHTLRGMVHVGVWRHEALTAWTDPPCPILGDLQNQVKRQLQDGKKITATLYRQIGRHLDPDPNRRPGDERDPLCPLCVAERERSRREYWWLLIMLMPFPALAARPSFRPVALSTAAGPATIAPRGPGVPGSGTPPVLAGRGHRNRRKRQARWAAAAAVLLLLIAVGALVAPRIAASTGAPPRTTGPAPGNDPPRLGGTLPDTAHPTTSPTSSPGGPGNRPAGDPTASRSGGSAGPLPGGPVGIEANGLTFAGVADWDLDGYQDIVAQDANGVLWLYPGDPEGGRLREARVQIGHGWNGFTFVGVADWDGDQIPDIVAQDPTGVLWVYLGQGERGYLGLARVQIGNGPWNGLTFVGLADWDGDEGHDIDLVARDATGVLWLIFRQYVGELPRLARVQIGNGWNGYTFAGIANWDDDDRDPGTATRLPGTQDILVRDDAGLLWLYLGQGVAEYRGLARVQIGNGWNGFTFAGLADWNHDGHQDIVTRDATGVLWLYLGQSVAEYRGLARVQIG
jgi:hypothetical protein